MASAHTRAFDACRGTAAVRCRAGNEERDWALSSGSNARPAGRQSGEEVLRR